MKKRLYRVACKQNVKKKKKKKEEKKKEQADDRQIDKYRKN